MAIHMWNRVARVVCAQSQSSDRKSSEIRERIKNTPHTVFSRHRGSLTSEIMRSQLSMSYQLVSRPFLAFPPRRLASTAHGTAQRAQRTRLSLRPETHCVLGLPTVCTLAHCPLLSQVSTRHTSHQQPLSEHKLLSRNVHPRYFYRFTSFGAMSCVLCLDRCCTQ